jgi:hypothetical protein
LLLSKCVKRFFLLVLNVVHELLEGGIVGKQFERSPIFQQRFDGSSHCFIAPPKDYVPSRVLGMDLGPLAADLHSLKHSPFLQV